MPDYADRGTSGASVGGGGVGTSSAVQKLPGKQSLVQALPQPGAAASAPEAVHQHAQEGVSGGGGALPHLSLIQKSFGHHQVGGVSAHVGGKAAAATGAIGAKAYATGNAVAFGGAPDLHTAAHEAAHVVQQRGGVQLKGGVGQEGDSHERHADAVADRVVRGESAVDLLDAGAGGGGGGGAAVQRKWDASAETKIAGLPKTVSAGEAAYNEAQALIAQYDKIDDATIKPTDLKILQDLLTKLGAVIDAVKEPEKVALRAVKAAALNEEDRARYVMQHKATQDKFKGGVPRYLNITPTPGSNEAQATGAKGRYDSSIPVDEQYRVGVPTTEKKDLDITVDGPGGVIDLLVVSGGHGGVGELFVSSDDDGHFSEDWWSKQVGILAGKNVHAKLIVLDACLTASVAPKFAPLLAPGGKIVGYVHSIPQMVMTDQIWKQVHDLGGKTVEQVIEARLGQVTAEHADSRHASPLGATVAVAVYDADRKNLHYDEQALSDDTVAKLTHEPKDQSEAKAMKRHLGANAQPRTGYTPSVTGHEGGAAPVANDKVVSADDLASHYLDSMFMPADVDDLNVGDVITTHASEPWTVKSIDPDKLKLTITPGGQATTT